MSKVWLFFLLYFLGNFCRFCLIFRFNEMLTIVLKIAYKRGLIIEDIVRKKGGVHSFRGGGAVKLSNTIVIDMSNLVESGHTARTLISFV